LCIYLWTTTIPTYTHIHLSTHVHTCPCPHILKHLHIYSLHIKELLVLCWKCNKRGKTDRWVPLDTDKKVPWGPERSRVPS
jgi:hypothetical protein